MWLRDRLANLVSGLGTAKDKVSSSVHLLSILSPDEIEAAYRSDWISRKIVDVPALDETREWRDWQAKDDQIEAIEAEESRHGLQRKVLAARKLARLQGGSALYLGILGDEPSEPLDLNRIKKGGLSYVHVFGRYEITAGELIRDPLSPLYGEPQSYTLNGIDGQQVTIHPSRVVRFVGAEVPNRMLTRDAWGDSVLQAVNDAVIHAGLAASSIAALMQEAKVDIIKIPQLSELIGHADFRSRAIERFSLSNQTKSMVNAVLLDKEEEWAHKTVSFAHLPEVLNTYVAQNT